MIDDEKCHSVSVNLKANLILDLWNNAKLDCLISEPPNIYVNWGWNIAVGKEAIYLYKVKACICLQNTGLPDPLGPMIAENRLKGPILWRPRYDLKFSTSMYFKNPGMMHILLWTLNNKCQTNFSQESVYVLQKYHKDHHNNKQSIFRGNVQCCCLAWFGEKISGQKW